MPRSLPACNAPFLNTDQNTPPSPWVTIATVTSWPDVTSTVSPDAVLAGAAVVAAEVPADAAVVATAALVPPAAVVLADLLLSLPQAVATIESAASDAKT